MTIKGDMMATLVSRGKTWDEAQWLVLAILECANGPDFAIRYAREQEPQTEEQESDLMADYWRVIAFLKTMV